VISGSTQIFAFDWRTFTALPSSWTLQIPSTLTFSATTGLTVTTAQITSKWYDNLYYNGQTFAATGLSQIVVNNLGFTTANNFIATQYNGLSAVGWTCPINNPSLTMFEFRAGDTPPQWGIESTPTANTCGLSTFAGTSALNTIYNFTSVLSSSSQTLYANGVSQVSSSYTPASSAYVGLGEFQDVASVAFTIQQTIIKYTTCPNLRVFTFTSAMPNTNYSPTCSASINTPLWISAITTTSFTVSFPATTQTFTIYCLAG
jgi:hypothetical protein